MTSDIRTFYPLDEDLGKYLADSLRLVADPTTVNAELERVPGDLAYWGHLHASAAAQAQRAKLMCDQARAASWDRVRRESAATKKTVDDVKAAVETDASVIAAENAVVDADEKAAKLRAAYEGVRAKKEALLTSATLIRAEMGADPSVREAARDARRMKSADLP